MFLYIINTMFPIILIHLDYLITEPLVDGEESLPSPEDLKEKIIIKGKRLPAASEETDITELENKHRLAKELSDLVWYGKSRKLNSFLGCNCKHVIVQITVYNV